MSSNLDVKFTGDPNDLMKAFESIKRHNQDLIDQVRRMKQEQRSAADQEKLGQQQTLDLGGKIVGNIGKIAAGYLGVNALVQAGLGAYRDWEQSLDRIAAKAGEVRENIIAAASATGLMDRIPELEQFGRDMARRGVAGSSLATQTFANIAKANPGDDLGFNKKLTEKVLMQLPGVDFSQREQFSKVTGGLAKTMRTLFGDNVSPDQVVANALLIKEMTGRRFNEITDRDTDKGIYGYASGGMDFQQSLGLAASALINSQDPGFNQRLAGKLQQRLDIRRPSPGQRLSAEDREINRLAKMSILDRYNYLRNPSNSVARDSLLGNDDAIVFMQSVTDEPRITAKFKSIDDPARFLSNRIEQSTKTATIAQRTIEQKQEAQRSAIDARINSQAVLRENYLKQLAIEADRVDPIGPNSWHNIGQGAVFDAMFDPYDPEGSLQAARPLYLGRQEFAPIAKQLADQYRASIPQDSQNTSLRLGMFLRDATREEGAPSAVLNKLAVDPQVLAGIASGNAAVPYAGIAPDAWRSFMDNERGIRERELNQSVRENTAALKEHQAAMKQMTESIRSNAKPATATPPPVNVNIRAGSETR